MAIACLGHRKRGIARFPARHTCSYVNLTFIPKDLNLRFCHPTLKCLHSAFHRTIISIGTWEWSHGLYSCWLRHLWKKACAKVGWTSLEPGWNKATLMIPNSIVFSFCLSNWLLSEMFTLCFSQDQIQYGELSIACVPLARVSLTWKTWHCKISSQTQILPGNLDFHTKRNLDISFCRTTLKC